MIDECLRRMVRVPAGEFLMGADDADKDERPVHPVFLDEFYVEAYPVTIAEYAWFVRETGYRTIALRDLPALVAPESRQAFCEVAGRYVWKDGHPPGGMDAHPVTLVQYVDAVEYCCWLARQTG